MEAINDLIETEEFDREYTLKELLPPAILADLFSDMSSVISATVHAAGGDLYFGEPPEGFDIQHLIRSREGEVPGPIGF
ncbi:MAG: hypothetical protein P8010_15550, partial [Desulfosarcinaceae bacterium]